MRVPLVGMILALSAAGPAAAFPGGGIVNSLVRAQIRLDATKKDSARTCQAGRKHETTKWTLVGSTHKIAVVACEQPPRSQISTPSLKQLNTGAEATIG